MSWFLPDGQSKIAPTSGPGYRVLLDLPLRSFYPLGLTYTSAFSAYHGPALYNGSSVTVLPSSTVNATHWTANFVCSGCSKWEGYAIAPNGLTTFGYAASSRPVDAPNNASSAIRFHDLAKDHFEIDITGARVSKETFKSFST